MPKLPGMENYDYLFKYVILGDSGVGKSSILMRYIDNKFTEEHIYTIGCDFKVKTMNVHGESIRVQIWDTAGQQKFRTMAQMYYRNAKGVILVYDITDMESYENIVNWVEEVRKKAPVGIPMILIGNKTDLDYEGKRRVTFEAGKIYAEALKIKFIELSAKLGENIQEAF